MGFLSPGITREYSLPPSTLESRKAFRMRILKLSGVAEFLRRNGSLRLAPSSNSQVI